MKKKIVFGIVVIAVVSFAFSVWGGFLTGQQKSSSERENKEEESTTGADSDEGKGIKGKSDIPFERYNKIYNQANVKDIYPTLDRDYEYCEAKEKGKELQYSYIEFLFLRQSENGELKPVKTASIRYEDVENKKQTEECGFGTGYPIHRGKPFAFRVRFPVVRNCRCIGSGFEPGITYKFTAVQNIGRVSHTFEIPSTEKLDFISRDSKREPEPYRYPILVSDMDRPEDARENQKERSGHKTITVKNVVPERIRQEGPNSQQMAMSVIYRSSSTGYNSTEIQKEKNVYELNVKSEDDGDVTGGDISVIGRKYVFQEKEGKKEEYKKISQTFLLQYKANASSRVIDLNQNVDYRLNPSKTVKQIISLHSYDLPFNKLSKNIKPTDLSIWLRKDLGGQKPAHIYGSEIIKRNGDYKVMLEVPPGEYKLYLEEKVIDENFTWPPPEKEE